MKIQVVTVCVNYSDFLSHTLVENAGLFDKWIIVTDLKDHQTKELVEKHGHTCVQTNAFYEKGIFNKYAGINEGLKHVDKDTWVLFLDSDIVLHYETLRVLRELHLDKRFLYGIDRMNCEGADRWKQFTDNRNLLVENWLLTGAGMEFGARLVHYYGHEGENGRFEGWRPLGFFQLCHRSAFDEYPEDSKGCDHCDLEFARKWHRSRRQHIPELLCIHLESHATRKAINWYGRKSKPFVILDEKVVKEIKEEEKEFESEIIKFVKWLRKKISGMCSYIIKVLKDMFPAKPAPPYYSSNKSK